MDHIQDRMTEGSIAGKLVRFAVPLFIGNLFQQLYNTADALIVGNMLGNDALAAVSSTGTLVFLLVSFFAGISAGAGVAISRYYGAREHDKMELAIHTNIAFNIVAGILLTIVGVSFTPTILRWMSTPDDVFDQAALYVRIYFAGSLGLVMYNSCRGIMQAVGDSKHPLYYLIISSVLNVILDIVFIGVFKTDVDGAALATILAQFISFFLCAGRLLTTKEEYRVSIKKIGFNWPMLRLIVNYGLPSGLQNSVIAIANVVVQANINSFGKVAMAAYGAYSKLEGFAFLPVTSFTMALTTFVSGRIRPHPQGRALRSLERNNPRGAYRRRNIFRRSGARRRVHAGAGGHRFRRGEVPHLRAVLLPSRRIARFRVDTARRGQVRYPDGRNADLLVRSPRGVPVDHGSDHAEHQYRQLGLPAHMVLQHGVPADILSQG